MSEPKGFVKLHRAEIHGPIGDSDEMIGFLARLKSVANHRTGWFRGTQIKPGQLILSDRQMRERLYPGVENPPAINTIKSRLRFLQRCGIVSIEAKSGRNGARLVTINASEFDANADANADAKAGAKAGADSRRVEKEVDRDRKRYTPPSVDEVREYAPTLESTRYPNSISCVERFYDHYSANGWRQGKGTGRPIKDWQAAFRGWVGRQKEFSNGKAPQVPESTGAVARQKARIKAARALREQETRTNGT